MATDLILRKLTNHSRSFYPTLGPYLSRREIVKEIGGPIWDENTKLWYVALDGRHVAGFAATRDDGPKVAFLSAYTLPDYRRRGVYRTLTYARLADNPGRVLRAVCTPASLPLLLANGFHIHRQKGSFTEVIRDAA